MVRVNNLLLKGYSGRIGKDQVLRNFKSGTFSSMYPDMSAVIPSKNQTKGRSRFADAVAFAKSVMKDPEKLAAYKKKKGYSVYHIAVSEYLNRFNPGKISLPIKAKAALDRLSLTEPQLRAVAYIKDHHKLTNGIYRKLNEVSKATATRHLLEMAATQLIESNGGTGAGAFYIMGSWWRKNGLTDPK